MPALTQRPCFFDTLHETVDAIQPALDDRDADLMASGPTCPEGSHWTDEISRAGALSYGDKRNFDFEIRTLKGKPTRKYFHVNIWRSTEGRYELNTYVL
jgi:hypothetical protein